MNRRKSPTIVKRVTKRVMKRILAKSIVSKKSIFAKHLLLCSLVGIPIGCSPESKTKEVTAETSGFRPADSSVASAKPKANQPSASNQEAQSSSVPPLPNFQPGQTDPSSGDKSYARLKMTESEAPEDLLKFLDSVDRAMLDLQNDAG